MRVTVKYDTPLVKKDRTREPLERAELAEFHVDVDRRSAELLAESARRSGLTARVGAKRVKYNGAIAEVWCVVCRRKS